jgi:hypothetical protein
MKIIIIHTPTRIYRGHVEQWVNGPDGWVNGHYERVRRATARDRKTIITVR